MKREKKKYYWVILDNGDEETSVHHLSKESILSLDHRRDEMVIIDGNLVKDFNNKADLERILK